MALWRDSGAGALPPLSRGCAIEPRLYRRVRLTICALLTELDLQSADAALILEDLMRKFHCAGTMVLAVALLAPSAASQTARASPQKGAELIRLMNERKLSTIAAADPLVEGRFVAAMHIPGSQLLVIRAHYAAPTLLRERILSNDFRQVYLDLHAAGEREGRLFVIDSGADGLKAEVEAGQRFDIVWRDGREQTLFDGGWQDQKLMKEDYLKRFAEHEAAYAEMLDVLIASLRGMATP